MPQVRPAIVNLETAEEIGGFEVPHYVDAGLTADWSHNMGSERGHVRSQFLGSRPLRIAFETTLAIKPGETSVEPLAKQLMALVQTKKDGHPPACLLAYAPLGERPVVVDELRLRYTSFNTSGQPTRAIVYIALSELRDKEQLRKAATGKGTTVVRAAPGAGAGLRASPAMEARSGQGVAVPSIAAGAGAASGLAAAQASVKAQLQERVDEIKKRAQDAVRDFEPKLQERIQKELDDLRGKIGEELGKHLARVIEEAVAAIDRLIGNLRKRLEELERLKTRSQNLAQDVFDAIMNFLNAQWFSTIKNLTDSLPWIKNELREQIEKTRDALNKQLEGINQLVLTIESHAGAVLQETEKLLKSAIDNLTVTKEKLAKIPVSQLNAESIERVGGVLSGVTDIIEKMAEELDTYLATKYAEVEKDILINIEGLRSALQQSGMQQNRFKEVYRAEFEKAVAIVAQNLMADARILNARASFADVRIAVQQAIEAFNADVLQRKKNAFAEALKKKTATPLKNELKYIQDNGLKGGAARFKAILKESGDRLAGQVGTLFEGAITEAFDNELQKLQDVKTALKRAQEAVSAAGPAPGA